MGQDTEEHIGRVKGFTFDGDTGRTLGDLYKLVAAAGYTRDAPFVAPSWAPGDRRPGVLNSYLDAEGERVHILWRSDDAGVSRVVDVVPDAPSLARREPDGCGHEGTCGFQAAFEDDA